MVGIETWNYPENYIVGMSLVIATKDEGEVKTKIEVITSNMCYDVVTKKLRVKYGLEPEVEEKKEEMRKEDVSDIAGLKQLDWDHFDKLTGRIQE